MKPRTANQREVVALSAALPGLTEKQKHEARMAYGKIYVTKTSAWCSTCSKEWECDLYESNAKRVRCPYCGAYHLMEKSSKKRKFNEAYYFALIRVVKGWQVVRSFLCEKTTYRGEHSAFCVREAFQVWMKPEERRVVIGRRTRPFSQNWLDRWDWSSAMEIRQDHARFDLEGWFGSGTQLLPVIKRAGLKKLRQDIPYMTQIEKAMNDFRAEVLIKNEQWSMFRELNVRGLSAEEWSSIRICIRHKYIIKDARMWRDMHRLMRSLHIDTRNPKYICPDDLNHMHDEVLAKVEAKRAREYAERQRRLEEERREQEAKEEAFCEDVEANQKYRDRVGKWLGLVVTSGDIELKPLQNIRDFFDEGKELCHCVFRNEYYDDASCLIIGARVKGDRTETIELNLKTWTIEQCRGKNNGQSKYHDQIYQLMTENINKFKRVI